MLQPVMPQRLLVLFGLHASDVSSHPFYTFHFNPNGNGVMKTLGRTVHTNLAMDLQIVGATQPNSRKQK